MKIRNRLCAAIACTAGMLGMVESAQAADTYWRLDNGHISIVSNRDDKHCARLARQFLLYERLVDELAGVKSSRPLIVYSLSFADAHSLLVSEAEKKKRDHMRVISKFLPGEKLNIAAMDSTIKANTATQSLLLSYGMELMTTGAASDFPAWFQVGVAYVTNGVDIHDDGSVLLSEDVRFIPRVDQGKTKTRYDLPTILATEWKSLPTAADVREFTLRAREWALFGLVTSSERQTQFRKLASLVRQGERPESAVQSAFGQSLPQVQHEFEHGDWPLKLQLRISSLTMPAVPASAMRVDSAQLQDMFAELKARIN